MNALFHQDIIVAVLGSGSSGNATYIGDGHTGVLVDCGLSTKQIRKRMDSAGLAGAPIDAVLVTHEHSDHVGAAAVLDRHLHKKTGRHIPYYMTYGTRRGLHPKVVPTHRQRVHAGVPFQIADWTVEPFSIPHDTADPVAYVVQIGEARVGVITDFGSPTRLIARQLASVDVAVLEFNHDQTMLREGPYPWQLKQRIDGRHGHISNAVASDLMTDALGHGRLKQVVLAHLSDDNNTPELALRAAHSAMQRAGVHDVGVDVGHKRHAIPPRRLQVPWNARPEEPVARVTGEPQMSLFG